MSVKGLVQHEAEPSLESSSSVHVTLVLRVTMTVTIPTDGSPVGSAAESRLR